MQQTGAPTQAAPGRDARRHFRVRYPQRLRPRLQVQGRYTAVIDLSEGGVRIVNEPGLVLAPGATVSGALLLRSGEAARFSGRVLRVTPGDVALSLGQGFSYRIILREQRTLRASQPYFG